jgi:hypothetical protein
MITPQKVAAATLTASGSCLYYNNIICEITFYGDIYHNCVVLLRVEWTVFGRWTSFINKFLEIV